MLLSNVNEIIPHLYLTNWTSSNDPRQLQKYNIKAVLTIVNKDKPQDAIDYYKKNNIDYLHIHLEDIPEAKIEDYFDISYDFINDHINKGENVLVHCMAGVSRSTSLIINYLTKKYYQNSKAKDSPQDVVNGLIYYVRSKRPLINPNDGFIKKLYIKGNEYSATDVHLISINDIDAQGDMENDFTSLVFIPTTLKQEDIKTYYKNFLSKYRLLIKNLNKIDIRVYIVKDYIKLLDNSEFVTNEHLKETNQDPLIMGFFKGKFFSEYGVDPSNPKLYGNINDIYQYATELGKNVSIHQG